MSSGDIYYYYSMISGKSYSWSARGLAITITDYDLYGYFVNASVIPTYKGTAYGTATGMVQEKSNISISVLIFFEYSSPPML